MPLTVWRAVQKVKVWKKHYRRMMEQIPKEQKKECRAMAARFRLECAANSPVSQWRLQDVPHNLKCQFRRQVLRKASRIWKKNVKKASRIWRRKAGEASRIWGGRIGRKAQSNRGRENNVG